MKHIRKVISFQEFLGSIGGISGLILTFLNWIFGDFIKFEARFRWIKNFYKFKGNDMTSGILHDYILKENQRIALNKISLVWIYLVNYSMLKKFLGCYKKSAK